jgi:hypothetical protein
MTEGYKESEMNEETAALSAAEQQNEIVVLDDKDGSWKSGLGDGKRLYLLCVPQRVKITVERSKYRNGSSMNSTICTLDALSNAPVCIDETTKKGATTATQREAVDLMMG